MRTLSVPNGCSTVSRRRRIACGLASRRACTASRTCSCSHRGMRRSGVRCALLLQRAAAARRRPVATLCTAPWCRRKSLLRERSHSISRLTRPKRFRRGTGAFCRQGKGRKLAIKLNDDEDADLVGRRHAALLLSCSSVYFASMLKCEPNLFANRPRLEVPAPACLFAVPAAEEDRFIQETPCSFSQAVHRNLSELSGGSDIMRDELYGIKFGVIAHRLIGADKVDEVANDGAKHRGAFFGQLSGAPIQLLNERSELAFHRQLRDRLSRQRPCHRRLACPSSRYQALS